MRSSPILLFAILLRVLALPAEAYGQVADTSYVHRAAAALLTRLRADTSLPTAVRERLTDNPLARLDAADFSRLNDSVSSVMLRAVLATFRQIGDSACNELIGTSGAGILPGRFSAALLRQLDSAVIDQWLIVTEALIRSEGNSRPGGRVATEAESMAAILGVMGRLPDSERLRVATAIADDRVNQCWAMLLLLGGLAELPPGQAGPILRSMFSDASSPPSAKFSKPPRVLPN